MKKALLLLLALCCLTLPARAAGFYDLPADHWAADPIQRAVDAGVIYGCGDGSFQPGKAVTASQFCAILSRSFLKEAFGAAPQGGHGHLSPRFEGDRGGGRLQGRLVSLERLH